MSDERITLDGWEELERRLREGLEKISYLTVAERHGGREEAVGARINVPEGGWATAQLPSILDELRAQMVDNARGQGITRYRVTAAGPKGAEKIFRCGVVVLDSEHEGVSSSGGDLLDDLPSTLTGAHDLAERSGVMAIASASNALLQQALGFMKAFGELCLKQAGSADSISRNQAGQVFEQLEGAREQVTKLVDSVTQARLGEAEAQAKLLTTAARGAAEDQNAKVGQQLARDAVQQLAQLGQAFIFQKTGINPALSDVVTAIQGNAAMMEALNDPHVRDQLKDPANLQDLAAMMKAAAEHAQEKAKAQSASPPGATDPHAAPPGGSTP